MKTVSTVTKSHSEHESLKDGRRVQMVHSSKKTATTLDHKICVDRFPYNVRFSSILGGEKPQKGEKQGEQGQQPQQERKYLRTPPASPCQIAKSSGWVTALGGGAAGQFCS